MLLGHWKGSWAYLDVNITHYQHLAFRNLYTYLYISFHKCLCDVKLLIRHDSVHQFCMLSFRSMPSFPSHSMHTLSTPNARYPCLPDPNAALLQLKPNATQKLIIDKNSMKVVPSPMAPSSLSKSRFLNSQ